MRPAQVLEACDLGLGEACEGEVGQRRPTPQGERVVQ
jgi:hypothetical protein